MPASVLTSAVIAVARSIGGSDLVRSGEVGDDHVGAAGVELASERLADPPARTGDDDVAIRELHRRIVGRPRLPDPDSRARRGATGV